MMERLSAQRMGLVAALLVALFLAAASATAQAAGTGGTAASGTAGGNAGTAIGAGTQAAGTTAGTAAAAAVPGTAADTAEIQGGGMPTGFRGITLGMGLDRVKELLVADKDYFAFQGDEDVSLLPSKNETLIEVTGFSYVKRAFFQFYKNRLFTIILALNPDRMDYYSVYRQLAGKYGEPPVLNPQEMSWSSDTVRLSLERPLSVKYIDLATFNALLKEGTAARAAEDLKRQDFLNEF